MMLLSHYPLYFRSKGNPVMFALMGRQDDQSHLCAGQHHRADVLETLLRHMENKVIIGDSQHRIVVNGSARYPSGHSARSHKSYYFEAAKAAEKIH